MPFQTIKPFDLLIIYQIHYIHIGLSAEGYTSIRLMPYDVYFVKEYTRECLRMMPARYRFVFNTIPPHETNQNFLQSISCFSRVLVIFHGFQYTR